MKKNIMPTVVLGSICLIVALLLSLINSITAPIIEEAQNAAANEALLVVLPEGKNFKEITLDERYPSIVTKGYRADGGFVFTMEVVGYKPGLVIMVGIDEEGKIVAATHIVTNETFGMETELNGAYIGDTLDSLELVLATGATPNSNTSKAYFEAMKAALQAFTIANGGNVDIRTPEQILQDNCNAALGTTGVTFTKWFATEIIEGIDAVYVAADNSGRVFVLGEAFVGVKADGTVATAGAANTEAILAANAKIADSSLTEITELPEGIDTKIVKKAYVTTSGNYVFDLETEGYQLISEWGNGTPIQIKLSISADGKIIDCLTVSHKESKGYGEACATEDYYDQFRGASNGDIVITVTNPSSEPSADDIPADSTDKGVIASATCTTTAYQKAVKAAFAAFELLTTENGGEA